MLHASLDHNALSIAKFSRWLRAICTILLCRDTTSDRVRAVGFVEQAIGVLEEHAGQSPGDEVCRILHNIRLPGTMRNGLGLSHGRTPMVVKFGIQYRT